MKARISLILFFWLSVAAALAGAQGTDNTFYVKQFKGATVAAKIQAAELQCSTNAAIPCLLVIDPSLGTYAPGGATTVCASCYLIDYRQGPNSTVNTNVQVNVQAAQFGAACDGVTDDTAALNAALSKAGSLNAAQIPVMQYFDGLVNQSQGAVIFPYGKTCLISGTLIVPPGVTVDLNTATVKQTSTVNDAFRVSWEDITNRTSLGFYGVSFAGIKNGTIQGPGNSTAQNAGIFLFIATYETFSNLNVQGFKFGIEGAETQYNNFNHVYTPLNVVGKYLTARGGANGVAVNVTAYSGNGTSVTLTAANGFEQDNVTIAGCNGTNCPTALNGTIEANAAAVTPPNCEKGNCSTFTVQVAGVSTSGSGLTGVTATPTSALASLDNTVIDDMSDSNSKLGFWCQACGTVGVYRADYSYNQESEIVFGAQPGYIDAAHSYFVSGYTVTAGGSGCTTGVNQPVTFTGGTLAAGGTAASAYAWINGSGNVGAIFGVDGGNGYSVLPAVASVASCAVQPTVTVVGTSDAGLGIFDGTESVNRGQSTFYNARSESVIGSTGPTTGYAIELNSGAVGAVNSVTFENYAFARESGAAPMPYARIIRNYGNFNVLSGSSYSSGPWDNYSNPVSSGDVSAVQNVGGTISVKLPWGFMTDPSLAVVGPTGALVTNDSAFDGFNSSGMHVSNGYQASTNGTGSAILQGNVQPTDGTKQRVIMYADGSVRIGSSSGVQDVGYCRSGAGALSITDGTGCNANGTLAVGAGMLSGGKAVPVVSGASSAGLACWKSSGTLGTCSAGTFPSCSTCN